MAPEYWHRRDAPRRRSRRGVWRPSNRRAAGTSKSSFCRQIRPGRSRSGMDATPCLGDTISRLYRSGAGFRVTREYYFNDGGRQMRLLGESVRARYLQELGHRRERARRRLPGRIYPRHRARVDGPARRHTAEDRPIREVFRGAAVKAIFAGHSRDLRRRSVSSFDVFTNELDLVRDGRVDAAIKGLRDRGLVRRVRRRAMAAGRAARTSQGSRAGAIRPDRRTDLSHARHRLSYRQARSEAST